MISPLPALVFAWSVVALTAALTGEPRFAVGFFLAQVLALVLLDHRPYSVMLAPPLHISLLLGAFLGNGPETAAVIGGGGVVCGGAALAHQRAHNRI